MELVCFDLVGASADAVSPTLVDEICLYIYLYIYLFIDIYGMCVFRIHIHPAPFVHDAIFPHLHIGSYHVTTVAQETRLTGQKG